MAQIETWLNQDMLEAVKVKYLDGNVFSQDNAGNLIGVILKRGEENYSGGGTVSASVIRADGVTVAVSGALSGNLATVVLPQAAYYVPGALSVVIKLTSNGEVTTIGAVVANVYQSSTDTVVDPGTIIPDINALIAAIDAAVASIPADYSDLWECLAPTFDSSNSYVTGQYVTYNSGVYRFIKNHSGSWVSGDVAEVSIGGELFGIRSALANDIIFSDLLENGAFGRTSGKAPSTYRIRLATPFFAKKGTEIIISAGSLYNMIWELSSAETTGGNVIVSKTWSSDESYIVKNDCYIMLSFSKTKGGATETITVSDFHYDYYVSIQRTEDIRYLFEKTFAELAQSVVFNLIDKDKYTSGYYNHDDPYTIGSGGNASYLPRIRIMKGLTYHFIRVYAYFSIIVYDDGTVASLSNTTGTSENVTVTAQKDGYAYVTVATANEGTAMVVCSCDAPYSGAYFTGINNIARIFPRQITPNNYGDYLPTMSAAKANNLYRIVSTTAMTVSGTMTDVPSVFKTKQVVSMLWMVGDPTTTGSSQILFAISIGEIFIRYLNESGGAQYWTEWTSTKTQNVTIALDGTGDFTSFTEGIAYAIQFPGCHVSVMPGTYDIISEYETLYGNDFFTNYTSSATDKGVVLTNDIVVEFAPNAYIVCDYNGNNTYVQNIFSPLNAKQTAGGGGFTLINANVTSRNVRYAMHDERNQSADYYHNKYIGCHFNHDKESGSGYRQCIGGGLGKNGLIEIENCIFENPSDTGSILSWHNCKSAGARSQIFIRDSIVKGNVRFSWYGESTLTSTMMITGCKMYSDPIETQETSAYNVHNVEILAWGNEIGTPN